ncbi:hypothetical protein F4604DRAFT_1927260 [Suillus subluteus]|nr:hypothetical protein F4604DRAFT_1927260 [Suillus subluteus]
MVGKHVRFATPGSSDFGDIVTSSPSCSSLNSRNSYNNPSDSHISMYGDPLEAVHHKLRDAWWNGYAPLEAWILLKRSQMRKFKGLIGVEPYLKFKPYNMAHEMPSYEWTNDHLANMDIRYEMCFIEEFDEVTSMLANLQVLEMTHATKSSQSPGGSNLHQLPPDHISETGRVTDVGLPGPMHQIAKPDKSMHSTARSSSADPYDCGWEDALHAKDVGTSSGETQDPYDCGWEDSMDIQTPGPEEDAYDCGWNDPMDAQTQGQEEDAYDCGWDDPMDAQTRGPEEDPYDCGWEDATWTQALVPGSAPGEEQDPYDCGWDSMETHCKALFSTVDVANPYNCGWEDQTDGNSFTISSGAPREDSWDIGSDDSMDAKIESQLMDSEGPYGWGFDGILCKQNPSDDEQDIIDLTSSPLRHPWIVMDLTSPSSCGASPQNAFMEAGQSMHCAIQQLNSIGNEHCNEYIRNMVMPDAAAMPNPSMVATFMANWRLFGAYAETQDRVTELGEDLITIHRLLHIHRRIMDPLDAMITTLQQDHQEDQ